MTRKRLITADDVSAEVDAGRTAIAAPRQTTVITPSAWSKGRELGVTFEQDDAKASPARPARPAESGSSERVVDPSGVIRVRGSSVRLGRFAGAGPGREVGLTDVVTGKDRSPMTAGFMSWKRADSFPWKLDYDELDYVLEGVLHIGLNDRVVEGRPGDVLYIPKGSHITFGTPSRVRIFYVTYPADWAGAS